jgi:putative two-component system response regulator
MAIADVYDALISKRSYKEAFSHEQAREIIAAERGTHFDPEVADAFLRREDEFRRIAEQITDGTPAEEAERADPATRR